MDGFKPMFYKSHGCIPHLERFLIILTINILTIAPS